MLGGRVHAYAPPEKIKLCYLMHSECSKVRYYGINTFKDNESK